MFLAGAGKECCYDNKNMDKVPDGLIKFMISGEGGGGIRIGYDGNKELISGGFQSLSFGDEDVTVIFYDQDGEALYVSPKLSRRSV